MTHQPLNLFDWSVIGQIAVMILLLTVVLLIMFAMKEASAQAEHRRNLERMDKERYGRALGLGRSDDVPAPEKDKQAGVD